MIYVNSETILKIDRFSLLRYERVIHIWDILFLTITYFWLYYKKNETSEEVSFRYVAYTWGLTVAGY